MRSSDHDSSLHSKASFLPTSPSSSRKTLPINLDTPGAIRGREPEEAFGIYYPSLALRVWTRTKVCIYVPPVGDKRSWKEERKKRGNEEEWLALSLL